MTSLRLSAVWTARWTAASSRPALVMACSQCGTSLSELGEGVMRRRWEEQWSQAPTLVRIAVLGTWLTVRALGNVYHDRESQLDILPTMLDSIFEASLRLARFEVVSRLADMEDQ